MIIRTTARRMTEFDIKYSDNPLWEYYDVTQYYILGICVWKTSVFTHCERV